MTSPKPNDITELLGRARRGEEAAAATLLPLFYSELRALGASYFRQQQAAHTLQPTALVHEAFVKLMKGADVEWESRAHFFAVAAKAMRQILTDHARRKRAAKRGGEGDQWQRLTMLQITTPSNTHEIDLLALEDALAKLAELDERQCSIVEMRFLAGLTIQEVAGVLGVSESTVEREWRMARAWLRRSLAEDAAE